MTGFGRGAVNESNFSVTVELKTVNNRFLDISLRLSNEMQSLETEIKRLISGRLSRGRVDVNLQYERSEEINYELNRPMIAGYLSAMRPKLYGFFLERGVLLRPLGNVVYVLPPYVISPDELNHVYDVIVEAVQTLF